MAYNIHRDSEMVQNLQVFPERPRVKPRSGALGPMKNIGPTKKAGTPSGRLGKLADFGSFLKSL